MDDLGIGDGVAVSGRRAPRVLIAGGGPGGMAAGVWCARLGLEAVLFEARDRLGGQMLHVFSPVPDYPGIPETDGPGLARRFAQHVAGLPVDVRLGRRIERLEVETRRLVMTDGSAEAGDAVILATGVARRRLDVPGETALAGREISYSVSKELGGVAGQEVAVVGGGDAAFEGALLLARRCPRIHLLHRGPPRARADFRQRVTAESRIVVHGDRQVVEVAARGRGIAVRTDRGEVLDCDRLFVRIGVEPCLIDDDGRLPRDGRGYLMVDRANRCVEGIYAVGDVCSPDAMAVSVAVGHAMNACKHIQTGWL